MDRSFSIPHTIAAVVMTVVGYFLVLYFGTPIIQWALDLYGKWFVPERFGGGSEVGNPGLLKLLFRVLLLSGLAAWAAVAASFQLFEEAHARTVAVALALAVSGWAGFLIFLGLPFTVSFSSLMVFISVCYSWRHRRCSLRTCSGRRSRGVKS